MPREEQSKIRTTQPKRIISVSISGGEQGERERERERGAVNFKFAIVNL